LNRIVKAISERLRKEQFIILLLLICTPIFGQKSINVLPVKTIPPIDGKQEDIWSQMTSYSFFQLEPLNGEPSSSETKMILMQSKDTL